MADNNVPMDQASLLPKDLEDHDILNEFLDQRVFDSLNANTPVGNSHAVDDDALEAFHNDVFHKLKSEEPDPHNVFATDFRMPPHDQTFPKLENSEYLYASPENHNFSYNPSPKHSGTDSEYSCAQNTLEDHDTIRKQFSKVKFGNFFMNPCPPTIDVTDPAALDFSPKSLALLPYQLDVMNLPSSSRVETQIKLKFRFRPAPKETFLHIPQDLISKSKFCLLDPLESLPEVLQKNMLFFETYVMTSDLKQSCNVCSRCIKREQKRALRSKTGTTDSNMADSPTSSGVVRNNPNSWADEKMMKKAIFFNCKEIVCFPAPTGLDNDQSKSFDMSARIICYCRHHKEPEGFKLLFVVRDFNKNIVAKHLSQPIMIMDRKKASVSSQKGILHKVGSSSQLNRSGMLDDMNDGDKLHPLSPNSIDDSTSEILANTDTNNEPNLSSRGYKRKKLSFDDSYNSSTNPMFNGSGFSPLSNSDTNASIHNLNGKSVMGASYPNGAYPPSAYPQTTLISRQRLLQQLQLFAQTELQPAIQKIIPAQGPIRGGIEVTLLGFNFRPGLVVKFGSKVALATHCWSESTIVTYLPPAAQPGQVLVSFEDHDHVMVGSQQLIFTYTDDTDRQLIELALQIVGLKMNGKLEDAKNIAKRIVGSDSLERKVNANVSATANGSPTNMKQENIEWYDNAHKAVEKLSRSDLSTEEILINFLSLVDLPNCPIIIPNWQLCNNQGQSLLHLATLKKYSKLVAFLITHGCKIDVKDSQGLTPLFFASMCGYRDLINIFIECKSNWNLKLSNDKSLQDYSDLNVLDIFNRLDQNNWASQEDVSSSVASSSEASDGPLNRTHSIDSLNSMYQMNYGKHISRMVMESSSRYNSSPDTRLSKQSQVGSSKSLLSESEAFGNDSTDFADSEYDSEDHITDEEVSAGQRWMSKVNEADYYDDDYDDFEVSDTEEDRSKERLQKKSKPEPGLWQKMKTAMFTSDDTPLPSYDDLFPFNNGFMRPKTAYERALNQMSTEDTGKRFEATGVSEVQQEDAGVASDSSEDMAMSYMEHPRKTIENDKMLLFFWLPMLLMILGLFTYSWVTGYNFELIEVCKEAGRNAIGNVVVGNERLARVFTKREVI